jgi:hypothetical protein
MLGILYNPQPCCNGSETDPTTEGLFDEFFDEFFE